MRTIRPNLACFKQIQGSQTLSALAARIGVHQSTLSRVLDPDNPAEPGPRFVGACLLALPHDFDAMFFAIDTETAT